MRAMDVNSLGVCRMFARTMIALALLAVVLPGASLVAPGSAFAESLKSKPAKQLFGVVLRGARLAPGAIGSYARGCLAGGKQLENNGSAWQAMRLSRNRHWGHPKLIEWLKKFAIEAQTLDGWPGFLVGDISQPRGGPMLTGHRSHQVGLDVDIWYRPMPPRRLNWFERETMSSLALAPARGTSIIRKNWSPRYVKVLKRAASYKEVERVFVHPAVKKELCRVAGEDRAWLRKVRPIYGHNYHFHVRLACPGDSAECKPQRVPPEGDGCGKQLETWLKLVSPKRRKKLVKKKKKPAKRKKRRRYKTLADLPRSCRVVLLQGRRSYVKDTAARAIEPPERK